jgi:hypothetical protein
VSAADDNTTQTDQAGPSADAEETRSLGARLTEFLGAEQARDGVSDERAIFSAAGEPLPDSAYAGEPAATAEAAITVDDFYAYLPMHQYIFAPTREMWPGASVNAKCETPRDEHGQPVTKLAPRKGKGGVTTFEPVPVLPAEYLDEHRAAVQMTWCPGEPMIIHGRIVADGGWVNHPGCRVFNLYREPTLAHGDPAAAGRWLEHVHRVFPEGAEHVIRWLAQRVQQPKVKINHALVIGGAQGIGKDTILEAVKAAIGPWNFSEVSPQQLLGRFNGFAKSVILRISEAHDLGEVDRYGFYEHLKVYTAAPPDVIRCDEKHLREHYVMNVTGVIITSNHKSDGIYLPADDRRHYVAWSSLSKEDFAEDYWRTLWNWYYQDGGTAHVAAYLATLDLTDFDPKAPPPKTAAFWEIVDAGRSSEDAELADVLDVLNRPPALTLTDLLIACSGDAFREWLQERKNRRQIPHRLDTAGYVPVRNTAADDGLWKINGKRQVVYAKKALPLREQLVAASAICKRGGQ